MLKPEDYRRIRASQPKVTKEEAYAQMEEARRIDRASQRLPRFTVLEKPNSYNAE
jgi:hypothetical protein